jgi:hypothetical protein
VVEGVEYSVDLASAVDSLPEILARKAALEAHTNILQAVMTKVAERKLPSFFELEQKLVASAGAATGAAVRREVTALLRDKDKGSLLDKLRLLAIATLVEPAPVAEYEVAFQEGAAALQAPEPDVAGARAAMLAMRHARQLRSFGMHGAEAEGLSRFVATAATGLLQKAAAVFSTFTPVHVTRLVDRCALRMRLRRITYDRPSC